MFIKFGWDTYGRMEIIGLYKSNMSKVVRCNDAERHIKTEREWEKRNLDVHTERWRKSGEGSYIHLVVSWMTEKQEHALNCEPGNW